MSVSVARDLITQTISELEPEILSAERKLVLHSKDKGCTLNEQATLEQEGILDGNALILL
jgi:hypothetical protein